MLPPIDGPTFGRHLQQVRLHHAISIDDLAQRLTQQGSPLPPFFPQWTLWLEAVEQEQIPSVSRWTIVDIAQAFLLPVTALLPPLPRDTDGPRLTLREALKAEGFSDATIDRLGPYVALDAPSEAMFCHTEDMMRPDH